MFKKFTILFVLMSLFSSAGRAFAYSPNTTHAALTDEIVDFYNLLHPENKITPEEKEWVVEGSILEDKEIRPINHFYDPVRKIGWNGENLGNFSAEAVKSFTSAFVAPAPPTDAVRWVNDRVLQSRYNSYGGDRTWKQALEYFANGNKKEAYITLGHSLHLLEDMSVPDHTRNDPHPPAGGEFDSPYENYTSKWNRRNIHALDIPGRLQRNGGAPPKLNSIEEYLDGLARYSNKYFFSRDTIYDTHYSYPKIAREDNDFGYGFDEDNNAFPLVKVKSLETKKFNFSETYVIEEVDNYILDAYFSRLSSKSVLYGVGVIELFDKQAKDAVIAKDFPVQLVRLDNSNPFVRFFTGSFSPMGELIKIKNNISSVLGNVADAVLNLFSDSLESVDLEPETQVQVQEETQSPVNNIGVQTQQNDSRELANIKSVVASKPVVNAVSVKTEINTTTTSAPNTPPPVIVYSSGGGGSATPTSPAPLAETASTTPTPTESTSTATLTATSTPDTTATTTPNILISEIMYDLSGADTNREWIEIFNAGTSTEIISTTTFKFFEDGINHGLAFTQGATTIPAGGYAVVADDAPTFLSEHPSFQGTLFDSSFSLSNSGETLALKDNNVVVDEVAYSSTTGANGDNNSLQLINGVWVAATPTPGSENAATPVNLPPSPNFNYSPTEPFALDTVSFDASSSTDSDGEISLYSWDFGDSATASTSVATITHAYATSGTYFVQLAVFDNANSSGTTSTTIIVSATTTTVSTPTSSSPQILIADATTTWTASTGMCCQAPFSGHKALSPDITTYTAVESFLVTGVHIVNNTDNSANNHNGFGNLRLGIIDPANGLVMASSTNSCYGENGCGNFDFTFENSPLIPATFWLQFYVDDGLQGNADWSVNGIEIYGY